VYKGRKLSLQVDFLFKPSHMRSKHGSIIAEPHHCFIPSSLKASPNAVHSNPDPRRWASFTGDQESWRLSTLSSLNRTAGSSTRALPVSTFCTFCSPTPASIPYILNSRTECAPNYCCLFACLSFRQSIICPGLMKRMRTTQHCPSCHQA
jgi:hypothetical protein